MSSRRGVRIVRHAALPPEDVAGYLTQYRVPYTFTEFSVYPAAVAGKAWRKFRAAVIDGNPPWSFSSVFYV